MAKRQPIAHAIAIGCPMQYLRMECGMPAKGAAKHHVIAANRRAATCPGCKAVVDKEPPEYFGEPPEMKPYADWANGPDSGISSKTLLSAITGVDFARGRHDAPYDDDDLGRCVRLLDRFPELRPQLHKVAEKHAVWTGLVAVWGVLEALHRDGDSERVYRVIRQARDGR